MFLVKSKTVLIVVESKTGNMWGEEKEKNLQYTINKGWKFSEIFNLDKLHILRGVKLNCFPFHT